jgi:hypothetical protein
VGFGAKLNGHQNLFSPGWCQKPGLKRWGYKKGCLLPRFEPLPVVPFFPSDDEDAMMTLTQGRCRPTTPSPSPTPLHRCRSKEAAPSCLLTAPPRPQPIPDDSPTPRSPMPQCCRISLHNPPPVSTSGQIFPSD